MSAELSLQITERNSAGPVANAYEQSRARVSCITGPTGGGKTVSSAKKVIRVTQWQEPSPVDGVRRGRITVVTPTYRQAWDSVIPSYRETLEPLGVLDKKFGRWSGGAGEPATHVFQLRWPPYGLLYYEVLFRAINDAKLEDFVRGRETTAFWLPEMDTLPMDLIGLGANRAGRYPPPIHRPASSPEAAYRGVFGDANVPDLETWFYDQWWLAAKRPEHWHLFRQPSAYHPDAENMHNLRRIDPDYYANMAKDMRPWAVRRFLMCKPGYSRLGEPVHEDFDDEKHVAGRLEFDPKLPVLIGADGGGNTSMPAAVFFQETHWGQVRVLDEYAPDTQNSIEEFGAVIRRIMNSRFSRARKAVICGDPAMIQLQAAIGRTYAQLLQFHTNIEVRLAPSQDPRQRRRALRKKLQSRTAGGEESFQVDQRCVNLIKALAGGFHYRLQDKQRGRLAPVKNQSSHVAEGCEYGVLTVEGMEGQDDGLLSIDGELAASANLYPEPVF